MVMTDGIINIYISSDDKRKMWHMWCVIQLYISTCVNRVIISYDLR